MSTYEHHLDLQKDALEVAGCEKIFVDQVSGISSSRPGLEDAMSYLRKDDVLVVWLLDRLGRSLKNLIKMVANLEEKEIGFRSLQESIDTTSSSGRLIFHIFGALAEFERNLIKERTTAGLKAARARGKKGEGPRRLMFSRGK